MNIREGVSVKVTSPKKKIRKMPGFWNQEPYLSVINRVLETGKPQEWSNGIEMVRGFPEYGQTNATSEYMAAHERVRLVTYNMAFTFYADNKPQEPRDHVAIAMMSGFTDFEIARALKRRDIEKRENTVGQAIKEIK